MADGSTMRLPSRAWFVTGSDFDRENQGCVPDVMVEQPPQHDMKADKDAQLSRAVEVLLRPPAPVCLQVQQAPTKLRNRRKGEP